MRIKKLLALVLALSLVLSFAACKNNGDNDETTTAPAGETVAAGTEETEATSDAQTESTEATSEPQTDEEGSTAENSTAAVEDSTASTRPKPTQKGLNSTDVKKVLEFYKAAAKKTGSIDAKQKMTLQNIDCRPRNKAEAAFINAFEGIAKTALKANSTERTDVPGNEQALESNDIISANAVISGNYTIVTLNVKSQHDDKDTKSGDIGPVGHAVGTLGDITLALNEIPAVTVDYSNGTVDVDYTNAKVVAKIDNNTGKIVSGTWSYTTNVMVKNLMVTFLGVDIEVVRMGGTIDFVIKTND